MSSRSDLDVAYHEAAHAVARYCWGLENGTAYAFRSASIGREEDDALGRVVRKRRFLSEDLDQMRHEQIDARTRRTIEAEIMTDLAGMVQDEIRGVGDWDVTRPTKDDAGRIVNVHAGGGCSDFEHVVLLATAANGSDESAGRYIDWLWARTHDYLCRPDIDRAVAALADALVDHRFLSYRSAKQVIDDAIAPNPTEVERFIQQFGQDSQEPGRTSG